MKSLRQGKGERFNIRTNDAVHRFRKIGDFVERRSNYFPHVFICVRERKIKYAYYELKSGRRICPIHLERLVGRDELSRYERKCPVDRCDYETEPYGIHPCEEIPYTKKFEEEIE